MFSSAVVHPATMNTAAFRRTLTAGVPDHVPTIVIDIKDHYAAKVYQPGHRLCGTATIKPTKLIHFHAIEIIFLGVATTRIETAQFSQRAMHIILRLQMPLDPATMPVDDTLKPDKEYIFPFEFVIPARLTLSACSHATLTPEVSLAHTAIPPSVGTWVNRADLAPYTTSIEYAVKARVTRVDPTIKKHIKVLENSRIINVLSATPERSPFILSKHDTNYRLATSKTVRRCLLASKQGKLTVHAAEPPIAYVSADGRRAKKRAGVTVDLAFAATSAKFDPPKISGVAGKIIATTYHAAAGMTKFPDRGGNDPLDIQFCTLYKKNVSLFNVPMETHRWEKGASQYVRRDSGYSSGEAPLSDGKRGSDGSETSATQTPGDLYHSRVYIPFDLPTEDIIFIPSFYSCLLARCYTLKLAVTLTTGTELAVKVPLQIVAEVAEDAMGLGFAIDGLPSFNTAMEEALRPRVLGGLGRDEEGGSGGGQRNELPEYEGARGSLLVTRVI